MPPVIPQDSDRLTFEQKTAIAKRFMQIAALSAMICLRKDVGYRALSPKNIFITGGLMVIVAFCSGQDACPEALYLFAVIVVLIGFRKRRKQWLALQRGERTHTYSIGNSPFEFHRLPQFCLRSRRMSRYFDGLFFAFLGYFLMPASSALGFWLIVSGASLKGIEAMLLQRQAEDDLDIGDEFVDANRKANVMAQYSTTHHPSQSPRASGVPAGIGDDIRQEIQDRATASNNPPES